MTMPPVCRAVLCSMTTSETPASTWKRVPFPPQRGPPMSSKTLLAIRMRPARPPPPGWLVSRPRMLIPLPAPATTLSENVTSSTTTHGAFPSSSRTVRTMAKPRCDAAQPFSKRLPETFTRRAFFSSKRFFTAHVEPS